MSVLSVLRVCYLIVRRVLHRNTANLAAELIRQGEVSHHIYHHVYLTDSPDWRI